jgi:Fe-Mn family superoxide dismutase
MKNLINRIEQIEEEVKIKEKEFSKNYLLTEMKKIGIEKLPYSYNALKQFIDRETMDVHYNKHYKTYVEKLNLALDKDKYGDLDLEQIVSTISRFNKTVRNNAGGAYNHALFWKMLSPTKQNPKGLVLKRIEKDFGTIAKFKKEFEEVAKERFGSGWVWLIVTKNNTLKIMSTPNQDNPLMNDVKGGGYPILGLDLWEHAYYLKYKNEKNNYIKRFWDAVNWDFVEKLFKMKIETRLDEEVILNQIMSLNENEILSEPEMKSQSCSSEESKRFKELLFPPSALLKQSRLFGKFKDEYVKGWMDILKKAYPDNWKEKDSIFVGHEAGLYSKENTRSLLMNLTSSYSAFCVIHKDINTYLVNSGNQPISYGDNPEQNLIELRRFFSVLNGIRSKFFSSTSGTLKQVGGILKKTDCLGKRNEQAAQQIINQNLGENSCEIKSGAGHSIDMKSGIDANIKINSTENTAQIKPFTSTINNESTITVLRSSSTKSYNRVDLMVFVNVKNKVVKIYKTNGITIEKNNYIIPKENEVMTLFAKTELELIDCNQFLSNSSSW